MYVCVYIWACHIWIHVRMDMSGGQKTTFRSWLPLFSMETPGMELKFSGLVPLPTESPCWILLLVNFVSYSLEFPDLNWVFRQPHVCRLVRQKCGEPFITASDIKSSLCHSQVMSDQFNNWGVRVLKLEDGTEVKDTKQNKDNIVKEKNELVCIKNNSS